MDGVLVDTPYIACEATNILLAKEGINFSQKEFKKYLKFGIEDRVKIWNKEFDLSLSEKVFFKDFVNLQVQILKDDMKNSNRRFILKKLKKLGLKLALATKAKKFKVDKILKALKLEEIFDSIITGDTTEYHKPHPEVYLNSLSNLGIEPEDALVIEDSPHGIKSAKSANIKVTAYKTKVFSNEELKEADFIINDLNEIFNLLKKQL